MMLTAGQFIAMNQYKDVSDKGYMPALTPWPSICLTVSIAIGSGPSKFATPLQRSSLPPHFISRNIELQLPPSESDSDQSLCSMRPKVDNPEEKYCHLYAEYPAYDGVPMFKALATALRAPSAPTRTLPLITCPLLSFTLAPAQYQPCL